MQTSKENLKPQTSIQTIRTQRKINQGMNSTRSITQKGIAKHQTYGLE
jgi:uncharacterized protein YaaN involved in tellurite resistance